MSLLASDVKQHLPYPMLTPQLWVCADTLHNAPSKHHGTHSKRSLYEPTSAKASRLGSRARFEIPRELRPRNAGSRAWVAPAHVDRVSWPAHPLYYTPIRHTRSRRNVSVWRIHHAEVKKTKSARRDHRVGLDRDAIRALLQRINKRNKSTEK